MEDLVFRFIRAILIGLGATLTFDLWAQFLKHAFKIPPSNICLVGRWLRYMPEGIFIHTNILSAPQKNAECAIGWIAHYVIGILFATLFVALAGNHWLQYPIPISAILFGIVTVLAPLFILQPSFGFGWAASKAPNPKQARIRSLMNHTAFGVGLYLFGWLVNWLLPLSA
jgi:hypothetical protein